MEGVSSLEAILLPSPVTMIAYENDPPLPQWIAISLALTYYALSFVLIVPLTGVLVRFRANYNPKGLRLMDAGEVEQGGVVPVVGPVVTSYFRMFSRVYQLEGVSGLFKGLLPNLVFRTFFSVTPLGRYSNYLFTPVLLRPRGFAFILAFILFSVPAMTVIYRAMTTPSKLSPLKPCRGLCNLLTSYERTNLLRLYKSPGLLLTWTIHTLLGSLVIRTARSFMFVTIGKLIRSKIPGPGGHSDPPTPKDFVQFWVLFGVIAAMSSLLMAPLEVILVRLSLQRNNGSIRTESTESSLGDAETTSDGINAQINVDNTSDEDVIFMHPDTDPYTGMLDCLKRIVKEEGWATLYRGWWITFLFGGFQSSFL